MYSLGQYGEMIGDTVRTGAYTDALRRAVKPGSVVLDLGTGTGIFAMLACRFGARRVYAIEPADVIQVARDLASANGCADRIEFIQQMSTAVTLPERVDVIHSDLHGVLPMFRHHIPSIADARERFLAPGGVLIPRRETMHVAVVDSPAAYARLVVPWGENAAGLDMEAARRMLANRWTRIRAKVDEVLLPAQTWATLDYASIADPDVRGEAAWVAQRPGTAHGLILWFDSMLDEEIGFRNAPEAPETIYGNAFCPLLHPVAIETGDTVNVTLGADLVNSDYVLRWDTTVTSSGSPSRVKAAFRQSTFLGTTLSAATLRMAAPDYVPTLGEEGEIDRFVLTRIDGARSLDLIARELMQAYPARFADRRAALTRAGALSKAYSVARPDGMRDGGC